MPTQTAHKLNRSQLSRTFVRATVMLFVVLQFVGVVTEAAGQEFPRKKSAMEQTTLQQQFEEKMRLIRSERSNSEPTTRDDHEQNDQEHNNSVESRPTRTNVGPRRSTASPRPSGVQQAVFETDDATQANSSEVQPLVAALQATPTETHKTASPALSQNTGENKKPAMFLDLTKEHSKAADAGADAELSGSDKLAASSATASPFHVLARAVAWIIVALCLLSLAALGARRWQRQRGLLPTTNARSRVLETLSLGPGRTVSLIELAGFKALVASDAGGIRSLVLAPTSFHDEFALADRETNEDPVTMT